jgi:hypothetical protein
VLADIRPQCWKPMQILAIMCVMAPYQALVLGISRALCMCFRKLNKCCLLLAASSIRLLGFDTRKPIQSVIGKSKSACRLCGLCDRVSLQKPCSCCFHTSITRSFSNQQCWSHPSCAQCEVFETCSKVCIFLVPFFFKLLFPEFF